MTIDLPNCSVCRKSGSVCGPLPSLVKAAIVTSYPLYGTSLTTTSCVALVMSVVETKVESLVMVTWYSMMSPL